MTSQISLPVVSMHNKCYHLQCILISHYLQGSQGLKRFTIEVITSASLESLPRAHTCFNRIDFPNYTQFEQVCPKTIILGHVCIRMIHVIIIDITEGGVLSSFLSGFHPVNIFILHMASILLI